MEFKTIFLLVLFLPIISAFPTLQLQHEEIQPGETILATITTAGEFTEQIDKSQIKFFEGRKQITLEADILFYNETHYIYIYTNQEQNITLQIENILYKEDETLQSTTISKNLTISKNILIDEDANETYTQILKIKPGFITATTTPKLKLTNMGTREINITFNEEEISISSLSSHELEFYPEESFSFAEISTYKDFLIPTVFLMKSENTTFVSPLAKADLRQSPELLLLEIFTENKSEAIMQLFNFGEDNLTELEAISTLDFIKINELEDMSGRGIQNITIEVYSKLPGHFQGTINISYMQNGTKNILKIPLSIFVLPKGTSEEKFEVQQETCTELLGQVCESGFLCNGTSTFAKNAEYCCMASCVQIDPEDSESSSYSWLIGIAILAILGFAGYYFYKKQKDFTPQTSKDALISTSEKFEKRLAGSNSHRTSGNLTKS